MAGMKYDVFLSYSRADGERVRLLRDALQQRGYRIFFDVQSIDPGEQWKRRLERAIRASRTLVLCWSEHARRSDYCTFEYARAEALGKSIFPWLMDGTPLPAMLEVNGITTQAPEGVAAQLVPVLGWRLGQRRGLQAALGTLGVLTLAVTLWLALRPPPPWQFEGRVYEAVGSELPLAGVEVNLEKDGREVATAQSDLQGRVSFQLPQPRPVFLEVEMRKQGYERADESRPTSKPFAFYLRKLP